MIRPPRWRPHGEGVSGVSGNGSQLERQPSDVGALAPLPSFSQPYDVSNNRVEANPRIESRR